MKIIEHLKRVLVCVTVIVVTGLGFVVSASNFKRTSDQAYQTGHQDASKFFREWLLEAGYAEYDRKTGEWRLCDPNTIHGDFVEPFKRGMYVSIDDQIKALEDELILLRKQQSINSKRRQDIKRSTVDFKKL